MKNLVIVPVFTIAICGAGCFSRTEQATSSEKIMKRVEERQQHRRDEIKMTREVQLKELPEKLRTLAQTKESNKLAVARQIVALVPLHDVEIKGSSIVQIVKTVNVDIPPFTAKISQGLLAGKHQISNYNSACRQYKETIETVKRNTRAWVVKETRAPMILTTLATHDITLTFRIVTTEYDILLEEIVFRPADIKAFMEKRALQPGAALKPIQFENLYRPHFSSWPLPPKEVDRSRP